METLSENNIRGTCRGFKGENMDFLRPDIDHFYSMAKQGNLIIFKSKHFTNTFTA